MAQQMRNHDFDRPPAVVSDRRKRKHEKAAHVGGFFYSGLSVELQESLVEYTRHAAAPARQAGREALIAQDEEKLDRREERVITQLNKHIDQYAYAMELCLRRGKNWAGRGRGRKRRSKRHCSIPTADKSRRRCSWSICATRSRCACWDWAGRSTRHAGLLRKIHASGQLRIYRLASSHPVTTTTTTSPSHPMHPITLAPHHPRRC